MIRGVSNLDLSRMLVLDAPRFPRRALGRVSSLHGHVRAQALNGFAEKLESLQDRIQALQDRGTTGAVGSRARGRTAVALGGPLALETTPRFAALGSNGEVNAISTSFTPFGPTVSGLTTSLPTIGGVYDGDQGDDTLTFEFRRHAVVGAGDRLDVRVYDGQGDRIETLDFRDLPADTPVTLENGLTLSLSAGAVVRRDTFTVQVSTSVGSQVDPTRPFDGTRNDRPNFEPGLGVVAGSFEVNGVSIDVDADDSIDSVLAKIDAAGAGVTASFDVANERVVLTGDTAEDGEAVTVGNDTSGFLAATKLDTAVPELARDDTLANDPITTVAALSVIQDGSFSINGVVIDVDTANDSLGAVIGRINASEAGVTATLDSETSTVSIVANDARAEIELTDGTSMFFSGVGITPTTYLPRVVNATQRQSGFENLEAVRQDFAELRRTLGSLLAPMSELLSDLDFVRTGLQGAIESSFDIFFETGSRSILRSSYGVDFDFTRDVAFEFDSRRFERASVDSFGDLTDFLFRVDGEGAPEGLLVSLARTAEELKRAVDARLGLLDPKGRVVDLLA